MINWEEGLIATKEEGTMRELPQKRVWNSRVFVSKAGIARRRFYNVMAKSWSWGERLNLTSNEEGRMGYNITGTGFLPLELAICMAWLKRRPGSTGRWKLEEGKPVHARYLSWAEPETDEQPTYEQETWRKLNWRIGAVKCANGYKISSAGRLMNPKGETDNGFYYDGRRWSAVKDCGLVDLSSAYARLRNTREYMNPAIKQAYDGLMTGQTPTEISRAAGVELSTAWNYTCVAAEKIAQSDPSILLQIAPNIVSQDLWKFLQRMGAYRDERLGGPLKDLYKVVDANLTPQGPFRRKGEMIQMSELRFARLCLAAQ